MNTSATDTDSYIALASATQLLPVQLTRQEMSEYNLTFFPGRKGSRTNPTKRHHFPALFNQLGGISVVANTYLAFARYMAESAPIRAASGSNEASISAYLASGWDHLITNLSAETAAADVTRAMGVAATGQSHIIVPSKRYPGGMDIVMSGSPGDSYGMTSTVFYRKAAQDRKDLVRLESLSPFHAESKYVDAAIAIGEAVIEWANAGTTPNIQPSLRTVNQYQFTAKTWDSDALHTKINRIMAKAGLEALPGLAFNTTMPDDLVAALSPFFSVAVVHEPEHLSVKEKSTGNSNDPLAKYLAPMTLRPEIGFGIAINFPEHVARFITQTSGTRQIMLTPMNTWFRSWVRMFIRASGQRQAEGRIVPARLLPRYVLNPSSTPEISERRKKLGMGFEPTRANEDGLYVSRTGRFNFLTDSDSVITENAKAYEEVSERALAISYGAGAPVTDKPGYAEAYFATTSKEYKDGYLRAKTDLSSFSGALQTYSWDYNCVLTSSSYDPTKLTSMSLVGASKPSSLAFHEYLDKVAGPSLHLLFDGNSLPGTPRQEMAPDSLDSSNLINSSLFTDSIGPAYMYLLHIGKAPTAQELIDTAAKALGLTDLSPTNEAAQYDLGLYNSSATQIRSRVVNDSLQLLPEYRLNTKLGQSFPRTPEGTTQLTAYRDDVARQYYAIAGMFAAALRDAEGTTRTNLSLISNKSGISILDDDHFFHLGVSKLSDLGNVYRYLGGRVMYELLNVLSKADVRDLAVVKPGSAFQVPPFEAVVRDIKPFALLLTKYLERKDQIAEEAEELREGLMPDDSITPDDIALPGSIPGFELFPHQIATFKTLARKVPPKFAVLDIAPGGGKTIIGLTDVGNLIHRGLIKRPLIACPNGLVRNWIEDLHSLTGGKWNIIPLTTDVYSDKEWGEEALTALIRDAPINTIFVAGYSFVTGRRYQIVIGNHVETAGGCLEFCRLFNFDYLLLDESHKAKRETSVLHRTIKQLTVASCVKYVRLATGTLIQTKVDDVVGQTALFSSHVFRTQSEFNGETSLKIGKADADVIADETARLARQQLGDHVAVISFKRKEWAFMLPRPIENMYQVSLAESEEDTIGDAHQEMYQAILAATLEKIKSNKKLMDLLEGRGGDGDDDDADEDDDDDGEGDDDGDSDDLDTEILAVLSGAIPTLKGRDTTDESRLSSMESKLRPYLQRLEMMLTDPLGDPLGAEYFGMMNRENYVSNKVRKIVELAGINFKRTKWAKGSTYDLKDVVWYNDQSYVLMGRPGEKLTLESYEETYVSTIEPTKDPRWKPEPEGKVIIFCRYTRSVRAIYRALPPHLKRISVMFCDDEPNKWQNLESFRTSEFSHEKGTQIIIANEQAISEGHNLQMASRIIRVESPWSPGELDQSSSRIFRPDPSGKYRRENVYLDWVLCNNTMEVAKMGRLISRILEKTKFDEAKNPLYDPIARVKLPVISMGLRTIAATPLLSDIEPYLEMYKQLGRIQSAEFEEMRQRPSVLNAMTKIASVPMPKGSRILENVPYLSTLKTVPDRHNYGLKKLSTYLNEDESKDARSLAENPKLLVGRYVNTEYGNGIIDNVVLAAPGKGEEGEEGVRAPTRVRVTLASGEVRTILVARVYLANGLTKDNIAAFTPSTRNLPKKEQKKLAREERRIERERKAEEKKLTDEAAIEKRAVARAKTRQAVAKAAKVKPKTPAGKIPVVKKPTVAKKKPEPVLDEPFELFLYPVVFNGFLAVEAEHEEDDAKALKKFGFKPFEDYTSLRIDNKPNFDIALKWLDKHYAITPSTRRRLQELDDSFMSGYGRKFQVELSPVGEFKSFFYTAHRLSGKDKASGKPELKVYPVIINGNLFLNIDLATNPAFRKHANKVIPGGKNLQFRETSGMFIRFFSTLKEIRDWSKEVRSGGTEITDFAKFKEKVDKLAPTLKTMAKLAKKGAK